jgi:ADP-heptose:LPS heptosyltransferase
VNSVNSVDAEDATVPERVVLLVLNQGIGNTVMAVPILRSLSAARPSWQFLLLAASGPPEVQVAMPSNVRLLRDAPPTWRRFLPDDWDAILTFASRSSIDLIINLRKEAPADDRGYSAFKNIANSFGLETWDLHELPENEIVETSFAAQVLALLVQHGIPLAVPDPGYLSELRYRHQTRTLGVFLGASRAVKRWRAPMWRETIRRLLDAAPYAIEVTAGQTEPEKRLLERTVSNLESTRLSVVDLPDPSSVVRWTAGLDLLVAGDTSVLHLASAMGVPSIGLYFSTLGAVWGPASNALVLQSSIGARCKAMRINGVCQRMYLGCPAPCCTGVKPAEIVAAVLSSCPGPFTSAAT